MPRQIGGNQQCVEGVLSKLRADAALASGFVPTGTKRTTVIGLCILFSLSQMGCGPIATRLFDDPDDTPYLAQAERAPLVTVGIVAGRFVPEADFPEPSAIPEFSAGGAAVGAVTGAALWTTVILASGCLNPFAAATCPAAIPFAVGGAAVGGIAAGAIGQVGTTPLTSEQVQAAIKEALEQLYLQEHVRDRALEYAQATIRQNVLMASAAGPTGPGQQPDYSALHNDGIDTVLEISVLKAGMSPFGGSSKAYTLYMTARARLIRVSDATVLHDRQYAFISVPRPPAQWAEKNAEAFRRSMSAGFQDLAEQIVDRAFLVYAPPGYRERSWWLLGDLAPLLPEYPGKAPQGSNCYPRTLNWRLPEVDSVQPTLRWQAFPTPDMVQADQNRELERLTDVQYDVRLYDIPASESGVFRYLAPGDQILEATLATPRYTLEWPLKACGAYFLTYRARFNLGGLPRATQWAGFHTPVVHCWDGFTAWIEPSHSYAAFRAHCPKDKK